MHKSGGKSIVNLMSSGEGVLFVLHPAGSEISLYVSDVLCAHIGKQDYGVTCHTFRLTKECLETSKWWEHVKFAEKGKEKRKCDVILPSMNNDEGKRLQRNFICSTMTEKGILGKIVNAFKDDKEKTENFRLEVHLVVGLFEGKRDFTISENELFLLRDMFSYYSIEEIRQFVGITRKKSRRLGMLTFGVFKGHKINPVKGKMCGNLFGNILNDCRGYNWNIPLLLCQSSGTSTLPFLISFIDEILKTLVNVSSGTERLWDYCLDLFLFRKHGSTSSELSDVNSEVADLTTVSPNDEFIKRLAQIATDAASFMNFVLKTQNTTDLALIIRILLNDHLTCLPRWSKLLVDFVAKFGHQLSSEEIVRILKNVDTPLEFHQNFHDFIVKESHKERLRIIDLYVASDITLSVVWGEFINVLVRLILRDEGLTEEKKVKVLQKMRNFPSHRASFMSALKKFVISIHISEVPFYSTFVFLYHMICAEDAVENSVQLQFGEVDDFLVSKLENVLNRYAKSRNRRKWVSDAAKNFSLPNDDSTVSNLLRTIEGKRDECKYFLFLIMERFYKKKYGEHAFEDWEGNVLHRLSQMPPHSSLFSFLREAKRSRKTFLSCKLEEAGKEFTFSAVWKVFNDLDLPELLRRKSYYRGNVIGNNSIDKQLDLPPNNTSELNDVANKVNIIEDAFRHLKSRIETLIFSWREVRFLKQICRQMDETLSKWLESEIMMKNLKGFTKREKLSELNKELNREDGISYYVESCHELVEELWKEVLREMDTGNPFHIPEAKVALDRKMKRILVDINEMNVKLGDLHRNRDKYFGFYTWCGQKGVDGYDSEAFVVFKTFSNSLSEHILLLGFLLSRVVNEKKVMLKESFSECRRLCSLYNHLQVPLEELQGTTSVTDILGKDDHTCDLFVNHIRKDFSDKPVNRLWTVEAIRFMYYESNLRLNSTHLVLTEELLRNEELCNLFAEKTRDFERTFQMRGVIDARNAELNRNADVFQRVFILMKQNKDNFFEYLREVEKLSIGEERREGLGQMNDDAVSTVRKTLTIVDRLYSRLQGEDLKKADRVIWDMISRMNSCYVRVIQGQELSEPEIELELGSGRRRNYEDLRVYVNEYRLSKEGNIHHNDLYLKLQKLGRVITQLFLERAFSPIKGEYESFHIENLGSKLEDYERLFNRWRTEFSLAKYPFLCLISRTECALAEKCLRRGGSPENVCTEIARFISFLPRHFQARSRPYEQCRYNVKSDGFSKPLEQLNQIMKSGYPIPKFVNMKGANLWMSSSVTLQNKIVVMFTEERNLLSCIVASSSMCTEGNRAFVPRNHNILYAHSLLTEEVVQHFCVRPFYVGEKDELFMLFFPEDLTRRCDQVLWSTFSRNLVKIDDIAGQFVIITASSALYDRMCNLIGQRSDPERVILPRSDRLSRAYVDSILREGNVDAKVILSCGSGKCQTGKTAYIKEKMTDKGRIMISLYDSTDLLEFAQSVRRFMSNSCWICVAITRNWKEVDNMLLNELVLDKRGLFRELYIEVCDSSEEDFESHFPFLAILKREKVCDTFKDTYCSGLTDHGFQCLRSVDHSQLDCCWLPLHSYAKFVSHFQDEESDEFSKFWFLTRDGSETEFLTRMSRAPSIPFYDGEHKVHVRNDDASLHNGTVDSLLSNLPNWRDEIENLSSQYFITVSFLERWSLLECMRTCSIPVVMEGETGCGKSLFMKMYAQISGCELMTLDVHGETTESDIKSFIRECNQKHRNEGKQLVVFFDEINCSPASQLIKSIMMDRACGSQIIHDDLFVVAACNPENTSMYAVDPLPSSLRLLLWKIGGIYSLGGQSDELNKLLMKCIHSIHDERSSLLTEVAGSCSEHSEEAVRSKLVCLLRDIHFRIDDIRRKGLASESKEAEMCNTPLSMRDLDRLRKSSIFLRKMFHLVNCPISVMHTNDYDLPWLTSVCLALAIVYVFRIPHTFRYRVISVIEDGIKGLNFPGLAISSFSDFLRSSLEKLSAIFVVDSDVVYNQALQENLFMLFVSVYMQIPLFIVGKSGTSKSLAFSIFSNHVSREERRGFLNNYSQLVFRVLQCSGRLSAETIENEFSIAKTYGKYDIKKRMCAVVIEEIGLSHSSNNDLTSLRVLHKLLDECSTPFVAMSNMYLDAAKMNRGFVLHRDGFEQEEMKKMMNSSLEKYMRSDQRKQIVGKYFNQYEKVVRSNPHKYGLRDFYSFLLDSKVGLRNGEGDERTVIYDSLTANVIDTSSIQSKLSVEILMKKLRMCFHGKTPRRHTLIECNFFFPWYIIRMFMQAIQRSESEIDDREYIPIYRHSFAGEDEDISLYEDQVQLLKSLRNGGITLLNGKSALYPSIYDILNNFSEDFGQTEREKSYKMRRFRIALEESSEFTSAKEGFHIIVVASSPEVKTMDHAFLNRLQKLSISIEQLWSFAEEHFKSEVNRTNLKRKEPITKKTGMFRMSEKSILLSCLYQVLVSGRGFEGDSEFVQHFDSFGTAFRHFYDISRNDCVLAAVGMPDVSFPTLRSELERESGSDVDYKVYDHSEVDSLERLGEADVIVIHCSTNPAEYSHMKKKNDEFEQTPELRIMHLMQKFSMEIDTVLRTSEFPKRMCIICAISQMSDAADQCTIDLECCPFWRYADVHMDSVRSESSRINNLVREVLKCPPANYRYTTEEFPGELANFVRKELCGVLEKYGRGVTTVKKLTSGNSLFSFEIQSRREQTVVAVAEAMRHIRRVRRTVYLNVGQYQTLTDKECIEAFLASEGGTCTTLEEFFLLSRCLHDSNAHLPDRAQCNITGICEKDVEDVVGKINYLTKSYISARESIEIDRYCIFSALKSRKSQVLEEIVLGENFFDSIVLGLEEEGQRIVVFGPRIYVDKTCSILRKWIADKEEESDFLKRTVDIPAPLMQIFWSAAMNERIKRDHDVDIIIGEEPSVRQSLVPRYDVDVFSLKEDNSRQAVEKLELFVTQHWITMEVITVLSDTSTLRRLACEQLWIDYEEAQFEEDRTCITLHGQQPVVRQFVQHVRDLEEEVSRDVQSEPRFGFDFPKYWAPMDTKFSLNIVSGEELNEVLEEIDRGLQSHPPVSSVFRIQNLDLWERFCVERQRINRLWEGRNETIVRAFHGTKKNPPKLIYNGELGFDMRFSNSGACGRGLYFATDARVSYGGYAYTGNGGREIFLAMVNLGMSTNVPASSSQSILPEIPNAPLPFMRYNSFSNGGIHVVFQSELAYPLYIIKFSG